MRLSGRSIRRLIESVELFDVYTGDQVAPGDKSLAFNLLLRSAERTLQDREADEVIARVLADLGRSLRSQIAFKTGEMNGMGVDGNFQRLESEVDRLLGVLEQFRQENEMLRRTG